MTQKIRKILFILLIIFSLSLTYVAATDVNLNLPGATNTNTPDTNTNIPDTNSNLNNQNQVDNTTPDTSNEQTNSDIASNTTSQVNTIENENIQSSTVSTAPENGLGLSNIINILLITVGVIIILLAIAIIIRLKG
ncbi:MAG: hypothetical protein HFJ28_04910 [Clostridia bacterium]|nr:hypothetical protein [Clostridia bacterium]